MLPVPLQVIVVTNMYETNNGKRVGVRYMANGLKCYYMPIVPMVDQATLPTYMAWFPLFRKILLRERIDIVHGHAATSPLMHECLLQARTMGYKGCYTDHSLFGFADAASINVNKYLKFTLSDVDHAICVSHTCRENLVLRAALDPRRVSAIPNAVDASKFTPNPSARPGGNIINVVMVSRLVYRKGIDLVVNVIPIICARFPNVRFIIGGDGPKKLLLEEMRERHALHDKVELLGAVPHKNVRDVLSKGHIFLNTSLTESFCIAILEAACCGCFVVSTRVGGVPEVLPQRMIRFAEPTPEHLVEALSQAIPLARYVDPIDFHAELKEMYNWPEVAARTVRVYDNISSTPVVPLIERFRRYFGVGRVFGPIAVILMSILYFVYVFLEVVAPACDVDTVPDLPWEEIEECESAATVKAAHVAVSSAPQHAPSSGAPAATAAAAAAVVSKENNLLKSPTRKVSSASAATAAPASSATATAKVADAQQQQPLKALLKQRQAAASDSLVSPAGSGSRADDHEPASPTSMAGNSDRLAVAQEVEVSAAASMHAHDGGGGRIASAGAATGTAAAGDAGVSDSQDSGRGSVSPSPSPTSMLAEGDGSIGGGGAAGGDGLNVDDDRERALLALSSGYILPSQPLDADAVGAATATQPLHKHRQHQRRHSGGHDRKTSATMALVAEVHNQRHLLLHQHQAAASDNGIDDAVHQHQQLTDRSSSSLDSDGLDERIMSRVAQQQHGAEVDLAQGSDEQHVDTARTSVSSGDFNGAGHGDGARDGDGRGDNEGSEAAADRPYQSPLQLPRLRISIGDGASSGSGINHDGAGGDASHGHFLPIGIDIGGHRIGLSRPRVMTAQDGTIQATPMAAPHGASEANGGIGGSLMMGDDYPMSYRYAEAAGRGELLPADTDRNGDDDAAGDHHDLAAGSGGDHQHMRLQHPSFGGGSLSRESSTCTGRDSDEDGHGDDIAGGGDGGGTAAIDSRLDDHESSPAGQHLLSSPFGHRHQQGQGDAYHYGGQQLETPSSETGSAGSRAAGPSAAASSAEATTGGEEHQAVATESDADAAGEYKEERSGGVGGRARRSAGGGGRPRHNRAARV